MDHDLVTNDIVGKGMPTIGLTTLLSGSSLSFSKLAGVDLRFCHDVVATVIPVGDFR